MRQQAVCSYCLACQSEVLSSEISFEKEGEMSGTDGRKSNLYSVVACLHKGGAELLHTVDSSNFRAKPTADTMKQTSGFILLESAKTMLIIYS